MLERFGLVQTNIKAVKVGDVFDRLKVLAVGQIANTYKYYAVCQCSCGSELKRIRTDGLINGNVVGCGCVRNERTTTHGLTNHKHFKRWSHIMDRCYNERTKSYKDYGGRGISVCDAWHDVTTFINDLPDGYQPGMQIDRIDNNGNYEPGNVKWSTRKQQPLYMPKYHYIRPNTTVFSKIPWYLPKIPLYLSNITIFFQNTTVFTQNTTVFARHATVFSQNTTVFDQKKPQNLHKKN